MRMLRSNFLVFVVIGLAAAAIWVVWPLSGPTLTRQAVPKPIQKGDQEIVWLNPATNTWTPVAGSTVDLNRKIVTAPLQHFSAYAVGPIVGGKAGW